MKKSKIITLSGLFIITIILQGCPVYNQYPLFCYNYTSDTLGVYLSLESASAYPDTIIPSKDNIVLYGAFPNNKSLLRISTTSYKKIIDSLPKDTLSVFIISYDTLKMYDWTEIQNNYKILKRYDLSYEDLESLDFIISYPPTEAMKDIKMYPQ